MARSLIEGSATIKQSPDSRRKLRLSDRFRKKFNAFV